MIQYKPTDDDCRFNRAMVILRAVRLVGTAGEAVELTVLGKTIIVQPSHQEQVNAELNALLPQCERL